MPVWAAATDSNLIIVAIVSGPSEASNFDSVIQLLGQELQELAPVTADEAGCGAFEGE
jgi:hypothetical protein